MSNLPDEFRALIADTLERVREDAKGLYQGQPTDVAKADLHYLVHEKLEDALDRISPAPDERRELRRNLGRILHLMVEGEKA